MTRICFAVLFYAGLAALAASRRQWGWSLGFATMALLCTLWFLHVRR